MKVLPRKDLLFFDTGGRSLRGFSTTLMTNVPKLAAEGNLFEFGIADWVSIL
ncbi:MAG: hypothetical protein NT070_06730 [Cyanobacteria bacterium]|nr:hypothetical protein [Cyanobacteriota bacterium]